MKFCFQGQTPRTLGHVSSAATAAAIAAGVSLVVAIGSVSVTYLTTRASLRRDHERQQADFRRTMTERLYDRRVAVYPGLFAATDAFRNSRLNAAEDLRGHLAEALERLDDWHARETGMLLSPEAYGRLLDLRRSIRKCLEEEPDSERIEQLKRDIWARKGSLRMSMRADLGLLFQEDPLDTN
jgi:hypothetical protein